MFARRSLVLVVGFAVLSALLVASVWTVPYLPTNDGPQAVLAVHIENHYADPGTRYRDVFRPAAQFAGRGFTILYEPLEALLGWQRGLQVALSVILLTNAWGAVAFAFAVEPKRLPLAPLGFPLALSWCFYMGFLPFSLASGLGLFVLAYCLRVARSPSWPRRVGLGALVLVQAVMHVFAAALTSAAALALIVAESRRGRRSREGLWAALACAPAAAIGIAAYVEGTRSLAQSAAFHAFEFDTLHDLVVRWPRTLVPGDLPRAVAWTVFVVAAWSVALRRMCSKETRPVDRALSLLAVLFLFVGTFGPRVIPGWQHFSQRLVPFGATFALFALPAESVTERGGWLSARRAFVIVGAAASVSLALSFPFHSRLAAACDDAIHGLAAPVVRHGIVLPTTLEPAGPPSVDPIHAEVPYLAPLRHMGSLYATAHGGFTPYSFATSAAVWPFTIQPSYRPPPVPPIDVYDLEIQDPRFQADADFRARVDNELATYGMYFEGILLTGARREDIDVWKLRGFVPDWESSSTLEAHFVPCRIEVYAPIDLPPPLLDVGVGDSLVARDRNVADEGRTDATRRLGIDAPCGAIWVRPHWGSHSDRQNYCENAPSDGAFFVSVTRAVTRVQCTGERATSQSQAGLPPVEDKSPGGPSAPPLR